MSVFISWRGFAGFFHDTSKGFWVGSDQCFFNLLLGLYIMSADIMTWMGLPVKSDGMQGSWSCYTRCTR